MKNTLTVILAATLTVAAFTVTTTAVAAGGTYVIDGDTMVVDGVTVRIQGIDTPEKGEPCHAEATMHLKSLLAANDGQATIGSDAGKDRYGRMIATVRIGSRDVGLTMIRAGYAVARYDGTDGYAPHSRQSLYRSSTSPKSRCVTDEQQVAEEGATAEVPFPFWETAALLAVAAGIPNVSPSFDGDMLDGNYGRAASWLWRAAVQNELRQQQLAEQQRLAEEQRRATEAANRNTNSGGGKSGGGSNSGGSSSYNGPRCYAPGGRTWTPCP